MQLKIPKTEEDSTVDFVIVFYYIFIFHTQIWSKIKQLVDKVRYKVSVTY